MIRVLIADDQAPARLGNALVLDSAADLTVIGEVATGEEAVTFVEENLPDVVLMDVRMPGAGGIEATRTIVTKYAETKIVALTSFDLDDYAFGALEAGASGFLLKTATPVQLREAIRVAHRGEAVVEPRITRMLIEQALPRRQRPNLDEADVLDVLSPREYDVFVAIASGMTNGEISHRLFLSPATVKSHINRIFRKLGLRDRVHAVILAQRLGITNTSGRG